MSTPDPKRIVAAGYDRIGDAYARDSLRTRVEERERYTRLLFDHLPPGARVLDLGCGSGVPTTRCLAERFAVTGVEISPEQVRRARANVPHVPFVQADMTALQLPPASLDAVAAFYSIIHVPREELPRLFRSIHGWLVPGGVFVGALGAHDEQEEIAADWLGAPMYWSFFDADSNLRMLQAAGLSVLSSRLETADEDGTPVTFLWVLARKEG